MTQLRFLTAGESHGPKLTAILEGMIAGVALHAEAIDEQLARRQVSHGAGGRMRIERDAASITAGVVDGHTTGAPICIEIRNRDYAAWATRDIPPMTVPRPGHADLTGAVKYGYRDLRLPLERASARETAARVAVGAICQSYLSQFGIRVGGYVTSIGEIEWSTPEAPDYIACFEAAEINDVRCPDADTVERMQQHISQIMQARDTIGGIFEVIALGVPPGLGSHVHFDRRLSGRLAAAMLSIQAVKGVEVGPAFRNAHLPGTHVHDEMISGPEGRIKRTSNRAGGIEGGISNGEPIILRAAMKPISTTLTPLRSVDLATGDESPTRYERSDFCAVPRALVVGEAMMAWVLADELMRKLGGDSLEEQLPRFASLRQSRLDALPMNNAPWRFAYDCDPEAE